MSSVCRWWPLILVMSCGVLVLNLGERCSRALGLTRFDFAAAAGDAPDDEHTESGRSLLRREQEVCRQTFRGYPVVQTPMSFGCAGCLQQPSLYADKQ